MLHTNLYCIYFGTEFSVSVKCDLLPNVFPVWITVGIKGKSFLRATDVSPRASPCALWALQKGVESGNLGLDKTARGIGTASVILPLLSS